MSGGARILVIDDDPQIRRLMRMTLIGQGYEVRDASSGEEALDKLRESRFDLALLDVNMPGMGGLETCRLLRCDSDAAIVMLTVRDAERDKIEALDAGADDYVTKPFRMPELLARIRAALRRIPDAPGAAPDVVCLGNIEINFAARRVLKDGAEVRLTPKQFDLLRYLVQHPNVAVPHARLLQAVWGPDYGNEVEYLRVFVSQLRKIIEPNPSQPVYLITEPWVGYRLNLPDTRNF